jgi:hypothetical protein
MSDTTLLQWWPIILSGVALIGGWFTLKGAVNKVTSDFENFLIKEYKEFKEKQDKYIQEHYTRIHNLEIQVATTKAAQDQININIEDRYKEIYGELIEIKGLLGDRRNKND